jgi:glycosyltransferase involved in cell wall biosynthesis
VSNIFKSSDLFVLPSVWEGLGIAVIEAGLTGLPIVASNVDGIKEVISSEKEGILVEPKNSQELAKQLSYVIDNINTEKIKEMGKSLQQSIKARFSISVIARQYQDLYLQLVKEKGREE